MVFDEWQNGILVAFIVLEKVESVTLTQFFKHYQNVCQIIRCLMLSLLIMFKLKSMCWCLISFDLPTIPCLLLVYYSAYFVAKQNNLTDHFLLHIIFATNCRNPNLWLATEAKGLQGCEPSSRPGRHITCSRECKECKECKESRECEGVNPHTPKWTPTLGVGESWSPGGTPETSERVLKGQNSMACCALYINRKLSKCRCPKWARIAHLDIWNTSYGQKKGRESNSRESPSFDSRPLKVGNRPKILGCRKGATYHWKGLDEIFNFALDGESIGGLLRKLWSFKVAGVPKLRDFGTPTRESRESRDKKAIWMPPPQRVTEYTTRGKWLASPRGKMLASPPKGVKWWLTPEPGL